MSKKIFGKWSALIIALVLSVFSGAATAAPDMAPVMVSTEWLGKHLNDPDVVVIDMSSDETQYSRFHLPGASYLPYYYLVRQRKSDKVVVRLSRDELVYTLGQVGITRNSYVILYDDVGGLNVGRMFFELESIGHPRVSVLDGGLVKWILEGRKVVNTPVQRPPVRYGEAGKGINNEATLKDVDAAQKKGTLIIDARSQEEYVGDLKKKTGGHVAGARWWEWSDSVAMNKGFVRKSPQSLKAKLADLGLDSPQQPVIAYCHTGHRAAQTYLTLRSLGFRNVRLYAHSMGEYDLLRKAKLVRGMKP
ncbi:MAG: sulfurtransferase [Acidiferrobacterales bacterium]